MGCGTDLVEGIISCYKKKQPKSEQINQLLEE